MSLTGLKKIQTKNKIKPQHIVDRALQKSNANDYEMTRNGQPIFYVVG